MTLPAKLRALADECARDDEAMTDGPWTPDVWIDSEGYGWRATGPHHESEAGVIDCAVPVCPDEQAAWADANGIATTRNRLPALVEALKEAAGEIEDGPDGMGVRQLRQSLAEQNKEIERLEDLNGRMVPFGIIAAEAQGATQPPVIVEPDDSLCPRPTVFRVVASEAVRRFRDDHNTTARPPYIATVYSERDAQFISLLYNHGHHLVVRHQQALARVKRLETLVERAAGCLEANSDKEMRREWAAALRKELADGE